MKITVLGDGGWGTALAMLLVGNGHAVTQWGPFADYLDEMARTRANPRFLPGIPLPAGLRLTPDMAAAVEGAELVVLAAPVPYMRPMLVKLARVRRDCNLHKAAAAAQDAGRKYINIASQVLGD